MDKSSSSDSGKQFVGEDRGPDAAEAVVIEIESNELRKAGVKIARREAAGFEALDKVRTKEPLRHLGSQVGTEGFEGAIGPREIEVHEHAAEIENEGLGMRRVAGHYFTRYFRGPRAGLANIRKIAPRTANQAAKTR